MSTFGWDLYSCYTIILHHIDGVKIIVKL